MDFLEAFVGVLCLVKGGLCGAKGAFHGRRGHLGQHLSLMYLAAFFDVKCFQDATVFKSQVGGLTFFQIARIGVADDTVSGVNVHDADRDDTLFVITTDKSCFELLWVSVGTVCK